MKSLSLSLNQHVSRLRLAEFYIPLMLVLGTMSFWPIADGMLFWYFYRKRSFQVTWFTVGLIVIGVVNGVLNLHIQPVIWGIRIALVYSLMVQYRMPQSMAIWSFIGLLLVAQIWLMVSDVASGNCNYNPNMRIPPTNSQYKQRKHNGT